MLMTTRTLILPLAIALLFSPLAVGEELQFATTLSGLNENPPVTESAGTGSAMVTVDTETLMMRVEAQFSALTGDTTAAHIHCCVAAPGNVGVATVTPTFTNFPSGVTDGTYDFTYDMSQTSSFNGSFVTNNGGTAASAFQALLAGFNSGEAYFNIHTEFRPGGEIRGFLTFIPEPTSCLLLVGLAIPALTGRFGGRK